MGVKSKYILVGIMLLLRSTIGHSQGFYLKPSFSYGFALSKQEIRNFGSGEFAYVQSSDYKETLLNGNRTDLYQTEHKERVPLGRGKIFALEIGYESKKCLYYGLALSYGMMDKFTSKNFYSQTFIQSYQKSNGSDHYSEQHRYSENEQIVSPIWYGIEPSIGLYKKMGKYKLSASASVFVGFCRVRIIESTKQELNYYENGGGYIKDENLSRSNNVLTGSYMLGSSLKVGIEKMIGENSALGLFTEYRNQLYIPTKSTSKYIYTYYHILGSVVPDSFDKNQATTQIPYELRPDLLFESLSFGVSWKKYLGKKQVEEEAK